jgi:hypothetical protein
MNDPIRDYLIGVREELYRLADGHDVCFENYSEDCQFDKMRQAGDLLDEIIVWRTPFTVDYDRINKMHKEQEAANG